MQSVFNNESVSFKLLLTDILEWLIADGRGIGLQLNRESYATARQFALESLRPKSCVGPTHRYFCKSHNIHYLMFKDENKFRRGRKEIYVFLNFDLKNVDFGGEIQLMVK